MLHLECIERFLALYHSFLTPLQKGMDQHQLEADEHFKISVGVEVVKGPPTMTIGGRPVNDKEHLHTHRQTGRDDDEVEEEKIEEDF